MCAAQTIFLAVSAVFWATTLQACGRYRLFDTASTLLNGGLVNEPKCSNRLELLSRMAGRRLILGILVLDIFPAWFVIHGFFCSKTYAYLAVTEQHFAFSLPHGFFTGYSE